MIFDWNTLSWADEPSTDSRQSQNPVLSNILASTAGLYAPTTPTTPTTPAPTQVTQPAQPLGANPTQASVLDTFVPRRAPSTKTAQMQTDWEAFFGDASTVNKDLSFAGGTIKNLGGGWGNFQSGTGRGGNAIRIGDDLDFVALNNPDIADAWESQYAGYFRPTNR